MQKTLSDHEIRQVDLMKRSLAFFRHGEMDLPKLLNSLRDHFLQIDSPEKDWDQSFRVAWRQLDRVRNDVRDDPVQLGNVHMRDDVREMTTNLVDLLAETNRD